MTASLITASAVTAAPAARRTTWPTFRAEWTKLRTLRSSWTTATVALVASILLGMLATASDNSAWSSMTPEERATYDPTSTALVGVLLSTLVLGALAVRSITSEYGTGMIKVTFAAMPRRGSVLVAKATIVGVIAFVIALVSNAVSFIVGQELLADTGVAASLDDPGVVRAVVFGAIGVAMFAVVAVSLGVMLRRTASANIVLALLVIGGQLVAMALPEGARKYLPSSALQAAVTTRPAADTVSPGVALAFLVGYAVVAFLIAVRTIRHRNV